MSEYSGFQYVILSDHVNPTIFASYDQVFHFNIADEIFINKATKDTMENQGNWLVLWKKQEDGSWEIAFETYYMN